MQIGYASVGRVVTEYTTAKDGRAGWLKNTVVRLDATHLFHRRLADTPRVNGR